MNRASAASAISSPARGPMMWRAEEVAGVGVVDDLGEAVCLAFDQGHGVVLEGEALGLGVVAGLLRLQLGHADRRDLRVAVGDARDAVVVEFVGFLAGDRFSGDEAFGGGDVRKQEAADGVADGVDGGSVGPVSVVDGDPALVDAGRAYSRCRGLQSRRRGPTASSSVLRLHCLSAPSCSTVTSTTLSYISSCRVRRARRSLCLLRAHPETSRVPCRHRVLERHIVGSISMRVTSQPTSTKNEANSQPTAPAPTMMIDFGRSSSARRWSLLRMRSPSVSRPGMSFGGSRWRSPDSSP